MKSNDMKNLKRLNERYGLTNMTGFKLVCEGTDKETVLRHLEMDLKILKTSDVEIKDAVRIIKRGDAIDICSYDNGTPVTYFFTEDAGLRPEDIIKDIKGLCDKYRLSFDDLD